MKTPLFTFVLFLLTISSFAQESSSESQRKNGVTISDTLIGGSPFKCYQYHFESPDRDLNYSVVLPVPEYDMAIAKIRRTLLGEDYNGNYEQQLREEFAADSVEAALKVPEEGEDPKAPFENEDYVSVTFEVFPQMIAEDLIIFSSYISEYFGGAAHSTWAFFNDVFNLSTGERITQDDILDASEEHRSIVAHKLYELLNEYTEGDNYGEDDILGMLNDNFYFNKKELVYQYNPYEVAAYCYGAPDLSLSKKWLKPYLNPDGPLYQYWFGKKKGKKK